MSTIKDVANLAGVSICTVSRVLADKNYIRPETRKKVMNAVHELDYKPNHTARSLKTGNTNTIGLLLPDICNLYYIKITKYIEQYSDQNKYMILLCDTNESVEKEKRMVGLLQDRSVDGVIVLPTSQSIQHILKLEDYGIPYVFLNRNFPDVKACIPTDNYYGGYAMMDHLIQNGHKKIAMLFPSFDNPIYFERFDGAKDALRAAGLDVNVKNIFYDIVDMHDAHDRVTARMREPDPPTAFFAGNDMLCFGIYSALNELGLRIPQDVSVAGYDDISTSAMIEPALTTFWQPEEELAKLGVDYLLALMNGESPSRPVKLRGKVIARDSVAEAPDK
ncbi:LacI family DNA-binding transcriptional regulator [Youxingia wuxianensis]|uniref:LacI family DNA-binding transcriptional regulator n=1 Tax=Youxingia wuxianensis TaxID=2763678 RepID=A0A926ESJ2_9FIRM|nr:LacI family DNA-binding transcriptional regulator [Youxingia wuxianensis]MBC8585832.1 LacI family DNA-binding transcriptional regulator [Youxingia wuxianensis]